MSYSVNPDQMLLNAASEQGLQCLPVIKPIQTNRQVIK